MRKSSKGCYAERVEGALSPNRTEQKNQSSNKVDKLYVVDKCMIYTYGRISHVAKEKIDNNTHSKQ